MENQDSIGSITRLIAGVEGGSERAASELCKRFHAELRAVVSSKMPEAHRRQSVEDCVQEVAQELIRDIKDPQKNTPADRRELFRFVCVRGCSRAIDHLKRNNHGEVVVPTTDEFALVLDEALEIEVRDLIQAVHAIDPEGATILRLMLRNCCDSEIAHEMGKPKTSFLRRKQQLFGWLERSYPEFGTTR